MTKQAKQRAIKIPVSACPDCRAAFETLPGGRDCPECGRRCITALVILPRDKATISEAHALVLDVLARMRDAATTR